MKRAVLTSVAILALFGAPGLAYAGGNAGAGKAKAAACGGCHGENGEGVASYPALAGWSEDQIVGALQEYKSGKLTDPVMQPMVSGLSDEDISDIGAYYASLKK